MANQEQKSMPKFTCFLVGDSGKTKQAFVEQLIEGGFSNQAKNAQGVEVRPLVFHTTHGSLNFNILDATVKGNLEKLGKGAGRVQPQCVIVMFNDIHSDHGALLRKYMDIPTILCGKKGQIKDITKKAKSQYFYNIKSKNKANYEYLFLWLGGQLLGDMKMELLSMIAEDKPPMEGDFKLAQGDQVKAQP